MHSENERWKRLLNWVDDERLCTLGGANTVNKRPTSRSSYVSNARLGSKEEALPWVACQTGVFTIESRNLNQAP